MKIRFVKGSALITALFIMAIVAIAATAMALRVQIDIRRTNLTTTANASYSLAQGVPYWAIGQLLEHQNKKIPDTKFISFPAQNYEGAKVSGSILDMQSRFNINNLAEADEKKRNEVIKGFARLITMVAPKYQQNANAIALATAEWVLARNAIPNPQTGDFYKNVKPVYGIAYRPMVSISEFRLVANVTPELFTLMEPWITALPEKTEINLNTAPKEVILAVNPDLDPNQADKFIQERGQGVTDKSKLSITLNGGLSSNYFLVNAHVEFNNIIQDIYTLLLRGSAGQNEVKTIWESRGTV